MLKAKRRRKCKVCREWFRPRSSTQVACSWSCAVEYAHRQAEKRRRREHRADKERIKTLTRLCAEAQVYVNKYVRLRDAELGCISCDSPRIDDAGHLVPVGSKYRTSRIRFETRAIHGQCSKCNRFVGGGNVVAYRDGIERRYGADYLALLDEIKRMADQGLLLPLTKDEVRAIATQHRLLVREMLRA